PAFLVIDNAAAPSVFNLEARRRAHVKGRHQIVGVTAKTHCQRYVALIADVERGTDIVQRRILKHQVMNRDHPWNRSESNRMMAPVAVKEAKADAAFDTIRQLESQHS